MHEAVLEGVARWKQGPSGPARQARQGRQQPRTHWRTRLGCFSALVVVVVVVLGAAGGDGRAGRRHALHRLQVALLIGRAVVHGARPLTHCAAAVICNGKEHKPVMYMYPQGRGIRKPAQRNVGIIVAEPSLRGGAPSASASRLSPRTCPLALTGGAHSQAAAARAALRRAAALQQDGQTV